MKPLKEMRLGNYPLSNPVGKFLDWENGVVGKEGGELREGIAAEGRGEVRAKARDKESRLFSREGFMLNSWGLDEWVRWGGEFLTVGEWLDSGGGNGERRWAPKLMFVISLHWYVGMSLGLTNSMARCVENGNNEYYCIWNENKEDS